MASYTSANAIKKIDTGDEAGTWGASTNNNLDILDRTSNGYLNSLNIDGLSGSGTSGDPYVLPMSSSAVLSTGHYKVIRLTSSGTLSADTYLQLEQNTQARMYMFVNATTGSQNVLVTQGSGANVTIPATRSAIVLADGAGAGAAVLDFGATLTDLLNVVAGTVTASKAVVVDANKDITGFRNVTLTGELDAATLDLSGSADVDGDLDVDGTSNLDNTDIDGTLDVSGVVTLSGGTQNWTVTASGTNLTFAYNATPVLRLASNGALTTVDNITAFGTL